MEALRLAGWLEVVAVGPDWQIQEAVPEEHRMVAASTPSLYPQLQLNSDSSSSRNDSRLKLRLPS